MQETWQHRFIETNGIRMHYVEQGAGFPVLLLHGFPELWYSWRFQIPVLADAGFHTIAPDLRGFGETDKPEELEAYDAHHLVGDITGLLDALNIDKAVIIGHDWGGRIVWYMSLMVPERVERVVSLNTHFRPHEPVPPTQYVRNNLKQMRQTGELEKKRSLVKPRRKFKYIPDGTFEYHLQFQEPGRVEAEVMANPDMWLETMIRAIAIEQSFLTPEVLKVYADAVRKGGITPALNYYRNIDRNWITMSYLKHRKINMPTLMVSTDGDPILTPRLTEGMERWVPNVTKRLIKNCGHWSQQERPEEVNRMIIEFISDLKK